MPSHIVSCWLLSCLPLASSGHEEEQVAWSPRPPLYTVRGTAQHSLFPEEGTVHVLRGRDCELRHAEDAIWIVDFYSASCPHCWYFAPIFRQLARAYAGVFRVRFAACNCAEEDNRDACEKAQAWSYPTIVGYNLSMGTVQNTFHVPHVGRKDQPKTAKELSAWLSRHSPLLVPEHLQVLDTGPNFEGEASFRSTVAVDGPPGPPGWPKDYHMDDDRFAEARLGLIALLSSYSGPEQFEAALRVATFAARVFPQDCSYYARLVRELRAQGPTSPAQLRGKLASWKALFAQRKPVFCKDETCSVWQLLHVVAASVAAVATSGHPLYAQQTASAEEFPGTGNATVTEAMAFFRDAVDNFLSCSSCRRHFLAAFDGCLYRRCSVTSGADEGAKGKKMLLWLWRMHNAISLRVLQEHPPRGRQSSVDRRWPSYQECPGCWRSEVVLGQSSRRPSPFGDELSADDLDAPFDLDRTFGFLLNCYVGRENVAWEDLLHTNLPQQEFSLPQGMDLYSKGDTTGVLFAQCFGAILGLAVISSCAAATAALVQKRRHLQLQPAELLESIVSDGLE